MSVVGGSISVMSSSTHDGPAGIPVAVDRAGVLRALRGDRDAQHAAEVAVLRTTVDWAMLHASWTGTRPTTPSSRTRWFRWRVRGLL